MSSSETFVDLALGGAATLDDIDDFVDQWHDGPSEQALHDYLGLTEDEYRLWVERPDSLRFILFARRHDEPLEDVLDHFTAGELVAARASDRAEAQAVRTWLVKTGRIER